jgi:hypothetical protein
MGLGCLFVFFLFVGPRIKTWSFFPLMDKIAGAVAVAGPDEDIAVAGPRIKTWSFFPLMDKIAGAVAVAVLPNFFLILKP